MKVSVIMPTNRYGGLDILDKSMKNQTFKDFEVLVVDELHRKTEIESCGFIYVEPPIQKPGVWWNLDASLNKTIRQAKGDLIVQVNDYVYVPPEGIQKFVTRHEQEPKALISGISDQFLPPPADNLKGLYSVWNTDPGIPSGEKVFSDPRKDSGYTGFYLTIPLLWEGNWGMFPKKVWEDVGGYDERYDVAWGLDNVDFSERATLNGYHCFLDTYNEVYCWSHIKLFDEDKIRAICPNNQNLYQKLSREWYQGLAPTKLNYA